MGIQSVEQLALAKELVDDVELSHRTPEQLVLKALRLARLVGDAGAQAWLEPEQRGYDARAAQNERFGRTTDRVGPKGHWQPLAGIEAALVAAQVSLVGLRIPDVSFSVSSANPNEHVTGSYGTTQSTMTAPGNTVLKEQRDLRSMIETLAGIKARVIAAIHTFAVTHYHALAFGGAAETIFEAHREQVDELLLRLAPDALEKVPAVQDRLTEGDPEAVSQAMNTIRRILKALADRVFPPQSEPAERDGQSLVVNESAYVSRIHVFLRDNCDSADRRARLRNTVKDLNTRANAGTHDEVSFLEARTLFLVSYLVAGEILGLVPVPATEKPPLPKSEGTPQVGGAALSRRDS